MSLSNTIKRALSASPKVLAADNPKFYAMVLDFTQSSADILEKELLKQNELKIGHDLQMREDQIKAMERSVEQKQKVTVLSLP